MSKSFKLISIFFLFILFYDSFFVFLLYPKIFIIYILKNLCWFNKYFCILLILKCLYYYCVYFYEFSIFSYLLIIKQWYFLNVYLFWCIIAALGGFPFMFTWVYISTPFLWVSPKTLKQRLFYSALRTKHCTYWCSINVFNECNHQNHFIAWMLHTTC